MYDTDNPIFTLHISPYVTFQGTADDLGLVSFLNVKTGRVVDTPNPDRFLDNRSPFDWRELVTTPEKL